MLDKKRSLFILVAVLVLVAVGVATVLLTSQDDDKDEDKKDSYTIGIVNVAAVMNPAVDGLKAEMANRGYTEGKNVTYIYSGPVTSDTLQAEIQSLLDQKVDLLIAVTTPAATKAKEMTAENKLPVVFVPVTNPIASGIVTDLTRPGENITGIVSGQGETRRLEWLKTVDPSIERVYFPYNPNDASPTKALEELKPAAENLGLELVLVETPDEAAVLDAIANVPSDIDAIFLGPDSLVGAKYKEWVAKATELKVPTSASSQSHVSGGILCSYSYSPTEAGTLAAGLVVQILEGANPGDLPIETAEPQFSLNMVTADAIGLEVSDDVLRQAKIVIRE